MSKRNKIELSIIWLLVILAGIIAYLTWHGAVYGTTKPEDANWLKPYGPLYVTNSYANDQNSYNPQVTVDGLYLQSTASPQDATIKLQ